MPNLGSRTNLTGPVNDGGGMEIEIIIRTVNRYRHSPLAQRPLTRFQNLQHLHRTLAVRPRRSASLHTVKKMFALKPQRLNG